MFPKSRRILGLSAVVSAVSLLLFANLASAALYWSPPNTSINDGNSLFTLIKLGGGSEEWVKRIECQSTATGKTPEKGNTTLQVKLGVYDCELNGWGMFVAASGSTGSISLFATKASWDPYWGAQTGEGNVVIPSSTTYEFKIKFGTFLDCTIKTGQGAAAPGFSLAPYLSSLYSPEWALNKVLVSVAISGPTASKCGKPGSWYIDTWHPDTKPALQIIKY